MKKKANCFVFAILLFVTQAGFSQSPKGIPVIKIADGTISGTTNYSKSINIFKGIPFAAPPIGANRWRPPQPVKKWKGILKCDSFSASPMQPSPKPFSVWTEEFLIPAQPIGEDCLYLNVWAPSSVQSKKLPVVVWIYGGAFVSGGSAVPIYDGERTAERGIVFVSINYRVGIFGFFAHPQLSKQGDKKQLANYGLMDQVAALKWVQENIETFGGDKNNVTIAGQSAGGVSVSCLLASPLTKGLFHKAIVQSGAGLVPNSPRTVRLNQMETKGEDIFRQLDVHSIEQARNLPAKKLLEVTAGFGPVVDGYLIPDELDTIFSSGRQHKVPLMLGSNYHEDLPDSTRKTNTMYRYALHAYVLASLHSKVAPVYLYRFTLRMGVLKPAEHEFTSSFHSAEIPYVFVNLRFSKRKYLLGDEMKSLEMNRYWSKFIRDSNPNQPEMVKWQPYSNDKKWIMHLGDWPGCYELSQAREYDELLEELKQQPARN
jgi:para-nitrobenzyl esterase